MRDEGAFLATRPKGEIVRENLERRLSEMSPGETLVVDFSDVEDVTFSFADEAVAKLYAVKAAGEFNDRGVALSDMNQDIRETMAVVLERRNLVAVVVETTPTVLGSDSYLTETLEAALELRSFKAAELASHLGVSPQVANNRLRALMDAGAVIRHPSMPERGGKEFRYEVVVPLPAEGSPAVPERRLGFVVHPKKSVGKRGIPRGS